MGGGRWRGGRWGGRWEGKVVGGVGGGRWEVGGGGWGWEVGYGSVWFGPKCFGSVRCGTGRFHTILGASIVETAMENPGHVINVLESAGCRDLGVKKGFRGLGLRGLRVRAYRV